MKFALLVAFVVALVSLAQSDNANAINPTASHHNHFVGNQVHVPKAPHALVQNVPHTGTRQGRWIGQPGSIEPVYKAVWAPTWTHQAWPVADQGLYYSAQPVSGHKVVPYSPGHVPSWKVADEPTVSWKMASYEPSWKAQAVPLWNFASKEDVWKSDTADGAWHSNADWPSSLSGSVPGGPAFYAASPVAWSGPVLKKEWSWGQVQPVNTAAKPVSYYSIQPVEHPVVGKYKWVKPIDGSQEDSASYVAKPYHYSSTVVHEKPVSSVPSVHQV